ncbi:MAG: 16S rRNA (adenine(1518)-N(6)/adenine(1519)-N(6))-dimethyltransferase RsmA [Chromatiales bacterium]|nr:16S rRNA (adenine(1518)-N(6)/adenine(1519)-N(6))-dimethyltransferase RsmA [Chromatiales bacterium]
MKKRPRLGQHFLTDASVIQQIISTAAPGAGEHFVEIGPGRGALTGPLLSKGAIVHAVEIDPALAQGLRERFPHEPLSVHLADALEFDYAALEGIGVPDARLRLIGNLPYYLSTPLLFRLLESAAGFRDMTVMLQREVAERLCASPGSRRYGRLSVTAAARCRAEPCFSVAPGAFEPPPKVHSMVVRLTPDSRYRIHCPEAFDRVVRQAFSQRRKTVANALRGLANKEQIAAAGIDPTLRPEQIDVQSYLHLSELLP